MLPRPFSKSSPAIAVILIIASVASTGYSVAADRKAPPVKPAGQYDAFDAHETEQVTIAADPCDDPADCKFFRLPYVQHGLLPVHVIITNDSDRALSLDDARLQFISANNDVIPAATPEDINRRLFNIKNTKSSKIPMPAPIPAIPIHHAPVDKKITQDDDDFGFQGTIVNAHSTLAGYLFYDVKPLDDPALKGAQFYVKKVHSQDMKKELFAFSIPFDKWLKAQDARDKKTQSEQPVTPAK